VAKGSRQGGRTVSKQVGGQKGRKTEYPITVVESNETVDKQVLLMHYGILAIAVLLSAGLLGWGGYEMYLGLHSKPILWINEAWGVTAIASIFFLARGLFWLSIISPVMVATKGKAWKSQEELCRKALKFSKFTPGGGLTVAFMLVQSLLSRGEFDEAIKVGEEQGKIYENDPKMVEGLGPVCGAVGLAYQVKGDAKQSIAWSEKAIDAYSKAVVKYTASKKSIMTKITEAQGGDIAGSIRAQMTVSYFNNASAYFNMQNFRMAKQNFFKALETANLAPDFPDKAEIVKTCRDQMARLKHN
jgi:tetratricopeptide (TPR) repeat protein